MSCAYVPNGTSSEVTRGALEDKMKEINENRHNLIGLAPFVGCAPHGMNFGIKGVTWS